MAFKNLRVLGKHIRLLITMDTKSVILLVISFGQILAEYLEIQRTFEFEDVIADPIKQRELWAWRSEASGFKTLRITDHSFRYLVEVKVCIEPTPGQDFVTLHLDDVRYSNDGPFDSIHSYFDGEPWSVYSTYPKWAYGHDWNIFRNTGRSGDPKRLPRGEYVIGFSVNTDEYGIELDKLRLIAEYQKLDSRLFCGGRLLDFENAHDRFLFLEN